MQKLFRLANVAGLDVDNRQHSVALAEAMQVVGGDERFVEYVRENRESIQYATKVERLDILATRYEKIQRAEKQKSAIDQAKPFIRRILEKLSQCKTFIKNNDVSSFDRVSIQKDEGRQMFFSEKESKALNAIGSVSYVIEMYEIGELGGMLEREYMKRLMSIPGQKLSHSVVSMLDVKRF